jgi:hypothetical protein
MKKATVGVLALLVLVSASGCWGPQKLTRHMDDWANQGYSDNPWLMGNVVSCVLLHAILAGTGMIDGFINSYYFWRYDAWPLGSGTGTKFVHRLVTPTPTER